MSIYKNNRKTLKKYKSKKTGGAGPGTKKKKGAKVGVLPPEATTRLNKNSNKGKKVVKESPVTEIPVAGPAMKKFNKKQKKNNANTSSDSSTEIPVTKIYKPRISSSKVLVEGTSPAEQGATRGTKKKKLKNNTKTKKAENLGSVLKFGEQLSDSDLSTANITRDRTPLAMSKSDPALPTPISRTSSMKSYEGDTEGSDTKDRPINTGTMPMNEMLRKQGQLRMKQENDLERENTVDKTFNPEIPDDVGRTEVESPNLTSMARTVKTPTRSPDSDDENSDSDSDLGENQPSSSKMPPLPPKPPTIKEETFNPIHNEELDIVYQELDSNTEDTSRLIQKLYTNKGILDKLKQKLNEQYEKIDNDEILRMFYNCIKNIEDLLKAFNEFSRETDEEKLRNINKINNNKYSTLDAFKEDYNPSNYHELRCKIFKYSLVGYQLQIVNEEGNSYGILIKDDNNAYKIYAAKQNCDSDKRKKKWNEADIFNISDQAFKSFMLPPTPKLIEYNKLKILNLQEKNLQDEIVNFLRSFNKPIESYNKNDFRSKGNPNVIELKINNAVYRLKLIKINNKFTPEEVENGGNTIYNALTKILNQEFLKEKEEAIPCKEFKEALDNSKTKILVKKNGKSHGYIVKVNNDEYKYITYKIDVECGTRGFEYDDLIFIDESDIEGFVEDMINKNQLNNLTKIKEIVKESKFTNNLVRPSSGPRGEKYSYQLYNDNNEDEDNTLLKAVYGIRKKILVEKMFLKNENDYGNMQISNDEMSEIDITGNDRVLEINQRLIDCSLIDIKPTFSLYYNNFINLVNNASEDNIVLINLYVNEIFFANEDLKNQFMTIIKQDNKKPKLVDKLRSKLNNDEIIELSDLNEEGKFRHVRAQQKMKITPKKGGKMNVTQKKEENKRNKTLKKLK